VPLQDHDCFFNSNGKSKRRRTAAEGQFTREKLT
jgi:hypothetical protein